MGAADNSTSGKEKPRSSRLAPPSRAGAALPAHVLPLPNVGRDDIPWREALELWLRWSEEHERITAALFRARHDPERLESLSERIDQIDQLRWRAAELSQAILEQRRAG